MQEKKLWKAIKDISERMAVLEESCALLITQGMLNTALLMGEDETARKLQHTVFQIIERGVESVR